MGDFNRLNDRFFKFLFANPAYKFLLIALLNDVLADIPAGAERLPPIVDLTYADRESIAYHEDDKLPRFDVIARLEDGRLAHIEVQVEFDKNLLPRTLNYAARDYLLNTSRGEDYTAAQVICIVIVDFVLFRETAAYHTLHRILDVENGSWHMRGMEFHFIEMPKLRRRRGDPETGLERLLYYLGDIGGARGMEALAREDARVANMMALEKMFRDDPNLMRDYLDRKLAQRDYALALRDSRLQGRSEGRAEGRAEGRVETLAGLVRDGVLSTRSAASRANMTEAEFTARMSALQL